jgi:hypothetical protein
MSLSRPTAATPLKKLGPAAAATLALLAICSSPALAAKGGAPGRLAPEVVADQALCPGQTFSQPFTELGDSSYYTLVPGSEFNNGSEGWQLLNGAKILDSTRPDGSSGSVLDLPSGSLAVSPPVCVTLQYPTARIWTRAAENNDNVIVAVVYANRAFTTPKSVGSLEGTQSQWQLSEAFEVNPELGGKTEEAREVRFVFAASGRGSETQLYGLYVDPRMV